MKDYVIKVEDVTKIYKLYDKPVDRLKEALGFKKEKLYREHYALSDLSFSVERGECVGIIGTNGAGKSTILKIVTGVLNQTSGNVTVNGRISALLELGAGFNPEYTGIENVYINGTMLGFSREEMDAKMDTILKFADIGDFVNQPVKTYSSGMFVRLAFAVAINIDPEILIVDEALSVGDVFFQAKCFRKFEEFKEAGKTILFVSHDLGSISTYCDRAILLHKGKNVAEGTPKDIIDIYKKILVNQYDEDEDTMQAMEDVADTEYTAESSTVETEEDTKMWKECLSINPKIVEYGDKKAEIIDFCVKDHNGIITNTIEKDSKFKILMKVKMNEDIQEPIFAYTIKDIRGNEITGTNTLYEKVPVGDKKAGDIVEIEFEQVMTLHGNNYLLSLGCTCYEQMEFVVFHRLYDVCNITVISQKNSVGYYDMNSKVKIR